MYAIRSYYELRDDPSRPERVTVKGSMELLAGRPLTVGAWELSLTTREVDLAPLTTLLPESYGVQANGMLNLNADLHGMANSAATFALRAQGKELNIQPGAAYQKARPLRELQLSGEWQRTDEGHTLRKFAGVITSYSIHYTKLYDPG